MASCKILNLKITDGEQLGQMVGGNSVGSVVRVGEHQFRAQLRRDYDA